jgi:hypothetical protein
LRSMKDMLKILRFFVPVVTLAVLLFISSGVVFAQFPNAVNDYASDEAKEVRRKSDELIQEKLDRQKEREERRLQRCDDVKTRVQNKLDALDAKRIKHVGHHGTFKARLQEIVNKLNDKGYDTADLQEHIRVLEGMIDEYAAIYADLVALLRNLLGISCDGDSVGQGHRDVAAQLRALRKELIAKRHEIREYYRTVIREDIKSLRHQEVDNDAE